MSKKGKEPKSLPFDLPHLPLGWRWSSVEQVAQEGEQPVLTGPFGSSLGSEDFIPVGVPLLTIGCLTEGGITLDKAFHISEDKATFLDRYRVRAGDLLFSRSASVGRAGLVSAALEGSVINYHLMRLRLSPSMIDPRLFIYYVRGSSVVTAYLREVNHGATRDGINTTDLLAMPVAVPPPKTQRRIVAKIEELFSNLDAGVAALERAKANLKRYRAAVLKAAVEGNLTEDWRAKHPKTEPASKLLERILTERRKKWEADQLAKFVAAGKEPPKNWRTRYVEPTLPDMTGLSELPKGWCWVRLTHVALLQNGHAFPSKEYADSGVRLLRPGNLFDDGTVRWSDRNTRSMPIEWADKTPNHIVRGCELVMNLTAQSLKDEFLGRTCLTDDDETCLLNQRLARVTPCNSVVPKYLLVVLKSRLFRGFVNGLNTGSLIQHMFTSQLDDFLAPLPSWNEQQQIVLAVAEKLSQLEAAETTIDHGLLRAARLRQSILKQAFEGKLVPQDPKDEPAKMLLERLQLGWSSHETNGKEQTATPTRDRQAKSALASRKTTKR